MTLTLDSNAQILPEEKEPLVSIIILNFNGKLHLEKCLRSVFDTQYSKFEVILVDNASTDNSLNLVKQAFVGERRLRIVKSSTNVGFGPGNNLGFTFAKGDYIAFLNNDTTVEPDWLSNLVSLMEEDSTIGLAQSLILNMDSNVIQSVGYLQTSYLQDVIAVGENQIDESQFPSVFEVSFAHGAAMITRRQLIQETGLFDSQLPFFYDDTLLSLKTWLAGKRVVAVSKSKVYHTGGASWGGKDTFFPNYHILRARISLIIGTFNNIIDLTNALFVFVVCLIRRSALFAKTRNTEGISAYVRALFWISKNLKYMWMNRLKYWKRTKISPETLITKFIRIRIPLSLYLVPSHMLRKYCADNAAKYTNQLQKGVALSP